MHAIAPSCVPSLFNVELMSIRFAERFPATVMAKLVDRLVWCWIASRITTNPETPMGLLAVNIHQHFEDAFGAIQPHNIEAEQCLLGAILINNEAFAAVDALVNAEDFFEPINQEIFRICCKLIRAGKLANPITVKTFLPTDFKILNLTVSQYIA